MIDRLLEKFSSFISKSIERIIERNKRGIEWVGLDGLASMETSALFVIFLMLFCPVIWAMVISFVLVVGKSILDKSRGQEDEFHDFLCCLIGIACGTILGTVHAAVVLL